VNASPVVDAQSTYETGFALSGSESLVTAPSSTTPRAGWREAFGLDEKCCGRRDAAKLGANAGSRRFSEDDLAVEPIKAIGGGGHFCRSPHTWRLYENAF